MPATESLASLTSSLPDAERRALLDGLSPDDAEALLWDWGYWGRPSQQPPAGAWRVWLLLAGRGFGKTRTGAEWVRLCAREYPLVNIIGPTADDARDAMVQGESGILAVCPPAERPLYKKAERALEWPNGARTLILTADEPDRMRGKQHMRLWADEIASWRYPDAWDQAMFGLRLGPDPRVVATTTPKPVRLVRELLAREGRDVVVTRGSTHENADNLADAFLSEIVGRYEGTRLGRQELRAELLEDVPGALWSRSLIDATRCTSHPALARVVVGVDPEAESGEDAAETGIVVAGAAKVDGEWHGYVLEDATLRGTPGVWGAAAVAAYHRHAADRILGEVNNGGEMVGYVIDTVPGGRDVPYTAVRASRGKAARAEPVAGLYEQGRVHHVGFFPDLEDQLCQWVPGAGDRSPDRLDALVWALSTLLVAPSGDVRPVRREVAAALRGWRGR